MAFVKFMRNKFFHPHTYENQKRTWIAEQNHAAEKKRQEELHKQYLKEQAIYENKNLLKHGKLTQDDKLAFMYEPPMEYRKKEEKLELREVRFEWQKNAPRAGDYAKNLDVADCPFGIEVRNTKCIKCGVWGHMNTDKICPLYNQGINTEENPPDLGKEDPMSLLNSMERGGLKMRKHAINSVMDVHDNKYKMLEEQKVDSEIAFISNLTDQQKRKLMKKLRKSNLGGKPKAKAKKKKKEKKKKREQVGEECHQPKNMHPIKKEEQSPAPRSQNRQHRSSEAHEDRHRRSDYSFKSGRYVSPKPEEARSHNGSHASSRHDDVRRHRSTSHSPEMKSRKIRRSDDTFSRISSGRRRYRSPEETRSRKQRKLSKSRSPEPELHHKSKRNSSTTHKHRDNFSSPELKTSPKHSTSEKIPKKQTSSSSQISRHDSYRTQRLSDPVTKSRHDTSSDEDVVKSRKPQHRSSGKEKAKKRRKQISCDASSDSD